MQVRVAGLDIAKQVLPLHGVSADGQVALRKRLRRAQGAPFLAPLPPCVRGIEAGAGAQHWARVLHQAGHEVNLISPPQGKPYGKGNKNDYNDAEAICEAVSRPPLRFVAVQTVAPQDLPMLHRVRERCSKARTALVTQSRGLGRAQGIVLPTGIHRLRHALVQLLETAPVTPVGREGGPPLQEQWGSSEEQGAKGEQRMTRWFSAAPPWQRLAHGNGSGPLPATALVAAVANPAVFQQGRQVRAWLG